MEMHCVTRRAVLAGAGAAGLACLAGCEAYGGNAGAAAPEEAAPVEEAPAASGSPEASGSAAPSASGAPPAPGGGGPAPLALVSDIPVGGGKVFADKGVVVTQPTAGSIKAFSAECTHAGCTVTNVSGGTINCNCHGSKFKVADGSVAKGPAPKALAAKKVTVEGGAIRLG